MLLVPIRRMSTHKEIPHQPWKHKIRERGIGQANHGQMLSIQQEKSGDTEGNIGQELKNSIILVLTTEYNIEPRMERA